MFLITKNYTVGSTCIFTLVKVNQELNLEIMFLSVLVINQKVVNCNKNIKIRTFTSIWKYVILIWTNIYGMMELD